MEDLGVPCPSCGSLEVVVGRKTESPSIRESAGLDSLKGHVPQMHDCSCKGCRHTFRHDFGFSR